MAQQLDYSQTMWTEVYGCGMGKFSVAFMHELFGDLDFAEDGSLDFVANALLQNRVNIKLDYMDKRAAYILFEDCIKLNESKFKVAVNIVRDRKGLLHYCALINDVKPVELNINDEGIWYDIRHGATDISRAIGDLIERKCL